MPKPWWKRKGLRVTLIIVIVLGGLLVLTDRVAASIAEDKVATLISQEAGNQGVTMTQEPDVDMGGWPFVTQVFGGEYEQIDIAFRDITAQGVNLPELNVHATNVTAAMSDVLNGAGPVIAQSMTADARLTYDSISDTLAQTDAPVQISADGDQLIVTSTVDVFGTQIPVEGAATIEMAENAVKVTVTEMTAVGVQIPPGGDDLLDLCQPAKFAVPAIENMFHFMRMDADGCIEEWVLLRQRNCCLAGGEIAANGDEGFDTGFPGAGHHRRSIAIVPRVIKVGMSVNQHGGAC